MPCIGDDFSGWVRWKQTEIIYRINKVEEKIGDLVEEQKELLLELYQLQAYDRARMIAEKQLGMVNAEPEQIIKVDVTPDPNEEQGQEKEIADQADAGAES